MKIYIGMPNFYLPDIKTASYCPRLAAFTRCFNLLRDGRTSNAGGSAKEHIFDQSLLKRKLQLEHLKRNTTLQGSLDIHKLACVINLLFLFLLLLCLLNLIYLLL